MIRSVIFIAALAMAPFAASAMTDDQRVNNLVGVAKAVEIYKAHGMNGLADEIKSCYPKIDENSLDTKLEYCVAVNIVAQLFDLAAERAMGFPRDPRFSDEVFAKTLNEVLQRFEMVETHEEFMDFYDERVRLTLRRFQIYTALNLKQPQASKPKKQKH